MITRDEFKSINNRVIESLEVALTSLRILSPPDYVLFLADADYNQEYDTPDYTFSPYVVDNRVEGYKDETRLAFLTNFLSQFYTFPIGQEHVNDNEQRLNMELMIYTHIWESKPFLKKLFRLARLLSGADYAWFVEIPDMGKHDFIRNNIRQKFQNNGFDLATVIRSGYHSSLRNAFAHSEYSFDTINDHNRINLYNYKGQAWELKTISFNDWSQRFAFSALLSYHFLSITHNKRVNLPIDLGTSSYTIKQPTGAGDTSEFVIEYRAEHDAFNYLYN